MEDDALLVFELYRSEKVYCIKPLRLEGGAFLHQVSLLTLINMASLYTSYTTGTPHLDEHFVVLH